MTREKDLVISSPSDAIIPIRKYITDLNNLIFLGALIALFFMPLHEKLKAAGFWIMLAFWLTQLIKERQQRKIWIPPLAWALLVFVAVAFLSAIFSDYHNRATRGALDALRSTLFFIILVNSITSYERINYLFLALMGGIFIGDLAAIYQYFSVGPEIEMLSLGEKNSTAQVLSMFLVLSIGLLLNLPRAHPLKWGLVAMTGLTGYVLVLTYSRGIWLAVLCALIVFWLIRLDWKVPAALILLAAVVLLGMSFSERLTHKVDSLKNPFQDANMVGRYEIWKRSLEIVKDKPVLGIGLKTYSLPQVSQQYHAPTSGHAHNMFLNVMVELGIVGLLLLGVWLFIYLYSLIKMRSGLHSGLNQGFWLGGVGCFVVLIIGGMTHPMLGSESSLMLMTVLGLMFAAFRMENGASVYKTS